MLRDNQISAVLVSTDLDRAQRFYQDKAGLTLSYDTIRNHLVSECGAGTSLLICGHPSVGKAEYTQVRFWSAGIDEDVAELAANGVEFEEYDTETFKTVNHIVTSKGIERSAWSKDPTASPSPCSHCETFSQAEALKRLEQF